MRIGFCGLGLMGGPLAEHLIAAGHELYVWNRTRAKADALADRGAHPMGAPRKVGEAAALVITSLATSEAVEKVIFGSDGLASGMQPGSVLIEMSTIGPAAVFALRERLPPDVDLVDAPVLGSRPQALTSRLRVFVGASPKSFERVKPVLETFGDVSRIGPLGSGAAMKLVLNSSLIALLTALGEALALGTALGLEQTVVLDQLAHSPLGVTTSAKRAMIETGRFQAECKLAVGEKDAGLIAQVRDQLALDLPVATAAEHWMARALAAGRGEDDVSAVVETILGSQPERMDGMIIERC
jgi:3-hydroxyisobutyrate dehydrogenase-like beta-hydroxyacid dehydrogenase